MAYPVGPNEAERLAALHQLGILDTPREAPFDAVVDIARAMFDVPICLVSLVDKDRQWFKAVCGLPVDGTTRDVAFCNYTILTDEPLIVEDATLDPRFAKNALVTGEPFIRFYAGFPLRIAPGHNVGSFCIIDQKPRTIDPHALGKLRQLADIVVRMLEQHNTVHRLELLSTTLAERNADLEIVSRLAKVGMWRLEDDRNAMVWSAQMRSICGAEEACLATIDGLLNLLDPLMRERITAQLSQCREAGHAFEDEVSMRTLTGEERIVRLFATAAPSRQGTMPALVGALQDVTDVVRAREDANAARQRLELATAGANIGLWDWDLETDRFWLSPGWMHHLGHPAQDDEVAAETAENMIHPADRPALRHGRTQIRLGETTELADEFRQLDAQGDWRWVLSIGRVVSSNADGGSRRVCGIFVDIHDRKIQAERIAYAAHHDVLTGLANRAELMRLLGEAYACIGGGGPQACLLVLDLDRFKAVNDTFGHAAGDQILIGVAERLQSIVRTTDVVARLGGDEFAILITGVGDIRERASSISARILTAICEPFLIDGKMMNIGVSIGIAIAPDQADDAETLIRNADSALYKVKAGGKNAYRFFDDALAAEARDRRELEADLRLALARNELALHFQPEVVLSSGRITAAEALLRWRHPERGFVRPDHFIPIAEETGLIVPIGEWVIETAIETAATWPEPIPVAVNLSAAQLGRSRLIDIVSRALLRTGLSPQRLEIEVTESIFLRKDEALLSDLHQLAAIGVQLALDDFGTGYSSMAYLQKLPFRKIKIDKSFVDNIAFDRQSAAIVCAIINLAQSLDIDTTAEGIETEAQARLLAAAGCTLGQGYLFGRPMPAADLFAGAPDRRRAAGVGVNEFGFGI